MYRQDTHADVTQDVFQLLTRLTSVVHTFFSRCLATGCILRKQSSRTSERCGELNITRLGEVVQRVSYTGLTQDAGRQR